MSTTSLQLACRQNMTRGSPNDIQNNVRCSYPGCGHRRHCGTGRGGHHDDDRYGPGLGHAELTNVNSAVDKIILTGVIGDYGTSTNINKNGTVNSNGNYAKVALQHGGFEVNLTTLNKVTDNAPPLMANSTTAR